MPWLALDRYGNRWQVAAGMATIVWAAVFALLWFGLLNMHLATLEIVLVALPLAWLEMLVAAGIVLLCRRHASK